MQRNHGNAVWESEEKKLNKIPKGEKEKAGRRRKEAMDDFREA